VENGGYRTPCLNEKLYLHFKGYTKIENLEEFYAARCIWLEANGLQSIENLEPCKDTLRQLFIQQNCIKEMSGLEELTNLGAINLSENFVKKVDGLKSLTNLNTLQLTQNCIETYEDLLGLRDCPSISTLELNKNKIEDPKAIDILATLPNLKVLKLDGNPITRKMSSYRKATICRLKNLTYLDDRPVFPDERLLAEAWGRGGIEAEKTERQRQRKLKEWTEKNRHKQFFEYVNRARKTREAAMEKKETAEIKDEEPKLVKPLKPREEIPEPKYDVHGGVSAVVDDDGGSKSSPWALPRKGRAQCIITEVASSDDAAPKTAGKKTRDQKRASREARLKKAMQLVEAEKQGSTEEVPQEPAKPQVQEAPSTSDADELVEVEQEEEERKDVMASEALREAAKAHSEATTVGASAGKVEQTKWKAEMDSFTEEMAANDGQDLIVEDDTTMMIDLDELD
jgi:dynein assembly factor 1